MWGVYFGIILIAEKLIILKLLEKAPKIIGHIYATILVLISWAIFAFEDLEKVGYYISTMFHINGTSIVNSESLYYLKNYFIIIILGIILSTPIIKKIFNKIEVKKTLSRSIFVSLIYVGIFLLSTASLVSDTFNPFLYFRF